MSGRQALLWGIVVSIILTGLIWLGGGIPASVDKLPDQGAAWYYWKLPAPTLWSRVTGWSFFLTHQLAIWACIWWAQRTRLRYAATLHPINYLMLVINLGFIGLHFVQTYIWYDGLAQDTPIWSSLGAVAVLLVLVLVLETPRRGLLFGRAVNPPLWSEFVRVVRRYHGYYFSLAAIYTFWFHPLEATGGHLIGFGYMFLLLLQSSLIFNRAHLNRWWTFALEAMVLPHGVIVAWLTGNNLWPMFLFGFLGILLVTQVHGLPVGRWTRRTLYAGYVVGVLAVYGLGSRGLGRLDEVLRIPLIDYGLIVVLYLLFVLIFRATRLSGLRPPRKPAQVR